MTREERLDWLCRLRSEIYVFMPKEWLKPMDEALTDSIKALSQEPCDDAISRILKRMWNCRGKHTTSIDKVAMEQIIRDELPSVTQKSGKWIPVSERLPEENETVLINYCRLNEHSVRMAIWDELHCRFYNSEYTKYVSVDFVTAWMPLPKPYEPQESEDKE